MVRISGNISIHPVRSVRSLKTHSTLSSSSTGEEMSSHAGGGAAVCSGHIRPNITSKVKFNKGNIQQRRKRDDLQLFRLCSLYIQVYLKLPSGSVGFL